MRVNEAAIRPHSQVRLLLTCAQQHHVATPQCGFCDPAEAKLELLAKLIQMISTQPIPPGDIS